MSYQLQKIPIKGAIVITYEIEIDEEDWFFFHSNVPSRV